ncbi:MAG: hypothetical protein PF436_00460 [Prolixibacteraceae bacterium]|jgi:hypothetical protein|nr:hypothetical protein [Prolixibacteraceae bacterium]
MYKYSQCEFYGTLEKVEDFTILTQNIIPSTLVFESLSPFTGYHNETPHDYQNPLYLYMAVDKTYSVFEIARAFQEVRNELDFNLDAAKAFVKFSDKFYNVIRLRHLNGYGDIRIIQEAFERHGIKPLKSNLRQKDIHAHVTLKKIFCLEKVAKNLFIDRCEKNHAYIEIPRMMPFDQLIEVTQKVRNNWFESRFDAAMGYFLTTQKVFEIVRIYSDKLDIKYLEGLKQLYLQKIK